MSTVTCSLFPRTGNPGVWMVTRNETGAKQTRWQVKAVYRTTVLDFMRLLEKGTEADEALLACWCNANVIEATKKD